MKIASLIKNSNIIRIHPDETISSAISKLSSSHDAAFVFDDNGKYMGVVNPYYSLIKSSAPANAKAVHCLFHAPHVKASYSLSRVAQLMIESKVHYLPVFDEQENFSGIISARRMLSVLKGSLAFKIKVKDVLLAKKTRLVVINENDYVAVALSKLKANKISKLIVVNKDGKLKGLLSYYDLISFLIAPKEKEHKGERTGSKISFTHQLVKNFQKVYVLTLTAEDMMEEALRLIMDKKIGSVVIVDRDKRPIGIITTRDFLNLIMYHKSREILEVVSRDLSQENRQIVGGFFNQISLSIKKIPDIVKARLFVKEEKQGGVFKVNLSLFPKRGSPKVIKEEGKNLVKILKKIKKE